MRVSGDAAALTKGTSEYRSRYKGRATRSRSDSPHQRMLAGLGSDQNKITREPRFPSKRRVPFYPPQVSSSLQWERHDPHQQGHERSRPVTPPAVKPVARATSVEREQTPLAPRDSTPQEGTAAPSQQPAAAQAIQPNTTTAEQRKLRLAQNRVNHALRKRAGLKSEQQRNGPLSSEYQRQFMRKTPVADSPLLAAREMFYNANKMMAPFKSNPVIMESEYRRNFKGSPPPRPPRFRRDVEQCEVPEIFIQEKRKRKKKERERSRKPSLKNEVSHPELHFQQQEVRKANTEYSSNFRSPLQYCYRDGTWVKARTAQVEVQELHERAEAYRKRARGTHFSRQHFNQIMSEHNWMWEPSSGTSSTSSVISECNRSANSSPIIEGLDLASPGPSASVASSRRSSTGEMPRAEGPTLLVQRKLAWDEKAGPGERTAVLLKEQNSEDGHLEPHVNETIMDKNQRLRVLETDSSSAAVGVSGGSINGGRLPTPKPKTTQTLKMIHHDRTPPATGGTLLVSHPKIKNSFKTWKNESPLGNHHSPYRNIDGSPQRPNSKAVNSSSANSSPAAGLTTIDPLPIRYDAWSDEEHQSSNPRQAKPSQTQDRQRLKAIVTSPANKIQGTMRNPEFQHNGNLGIFRPELFVFPESDSAASDNGTDDKMSQISSRSAASCSLASEILDRAQRRKDEFWGKR
ncbi:Nuclear protein MDM1 [Triplophysa tibetana]|uniref:Nuclear protein MDM1 n=1 Tax=Triplophysa tibetana TaxID=1572043 RepID=A0A5A9PFX3_9TELE|nr:Nuclear protein MDM1 [Triplophysa tibetana]